MPKDLTQLFQENAGGAPFGFSDTVLKAVRRAADKHARQRQYLWGAFSIASLGAVALSGLYAVHSASASGFSSYFSLLFSDGSTIAGLWREVGLSLLESLPVVAGIAVLGSIVAVLWSLRNLSKYSQNGRLIIGSATRTA